MVTKVDVEPLEAFRTEAHDTKVNLLVDVLNGSLGAIASQSVKMIRQERPDQGKVRYMLHGWPAHVRSSTIESLCSANHGKCRACTISMQNCFLGSQSEMCVVIDHQVPVPLSSGRMLRFGFVTVLFFIGTWLMLSGWDGIHTQWHGTTIPIIGKRL